MRVLKAVCCAAMLTALAAPGVRADEWNKKTILTFSGPVQIPGATLVAGSYVFKLADLAGNRHVVQVFDKDEKKIIATLLAIPNDRLDASDEPVVLFSERPAGSPQAVKVWFYPGNRIGNEFVYPKSMAMKIAKANRQSVLAMDDSSTSDGRRHDGGRTQESFAGGVDSAHWRQWVTPLKLQSRQMKVPHFAQGYPSDARSSRPQARHSMASCSWSLLIERLRM